MDAAVRAVKDAVAGLKDKPQESGEPTPDEPADDFRFDDVKSEKAFYFDPVYWAYMAEPQITNGVTKTTFGPLEGCTRGQIVTFLYRAMGADKK